MERDDADRSFGHFVDVGLAECHDPALALETTGYEAVASWSEAAMAAVGAGGCSFVAEISPTADFASYTSIPAGGQGAPGPFELRLHLRQGSSPTFLVPLSTGYVRIRATAAGSGRTALSDVVSFTVPEFAAPGTVIIVK